MKMSEFLNMDMGELSDWMIENSHDYVAVKNDEHDRLTSENARLIDMLKRLTSHDNCRKDVIHLMSEADSLIEELEKGDE